MQTQVSVSPEPQSLCLATPLRRSRGLQRAPAEPYGPVQTTPDALVSLCFFLRPL